MAPRQLPENETLVRAPFLLEPRLMPKPWGGRALADVLGMRIPAGETIGEAWLLFDRPEGSSLLRDGDVTLAELVRRDPEGLVGRGVPLGHGGSFPLMLKLLDARERLSLQVHPDDAHATGDSGKEECCVVLHAQPEASFVHGVKPGVDREEFLARSHTSDVEHMVYSFRPEAGDVIHVPPGTVHGIGPGVLAFEVQQNSDITYRFYDWGRGREVQLDEARRTADVRASHGRPVRRSTALPDGGELLLATPNFVIRRYELGRPFVLRTDGGYLALTALRGAARLRWGTAGDVDGGELEMASCETVLVPACVDAVSVDPHGDVDLMACGPGVR